MPAARRRTNVAAGECGVSHARDRGEVTCIHRLSPTLRVGGSPAATFVGHAPAKELTRDTRHLTRACDSDTDPGPDPDPDPDPDLPEH